MNKELIKQKKVIFLISFFSLSILFIYSAINPINHDKSIQLIEDTKGEPVLLIADDPLQSITIDPQKLTASTYIGGGDWEGLGDMALDSSGNIYICGGTMSPLFPNTTDAYDPTHNGGYDVFIVKFSADGSQLLYSTFLGGSNHDYAQSIALDSSNNVYICGVTHSKNFPIKHAYDSTHNGTTDAFVAKLSADGSELLYSTFIGGTDNDYVDDIVLDRSNNVYITGSTHSANFPTTPTAFDSTYGGYSNEVYLYPWGLYRFFGDAYVSKISTNGSKLLYSTFIGGSGDELSRGITLDSSENIYITGETWSDDFPTTSTAYNTTYGGSSDGFITKISANGTSLVYSTFIGGSKYDHIESLTLDSSDNLYLYGETKSSDFPTTTNAYDQTFNGGNGWVQDSHFYFDQRGGDSFVTKLAADGSTLLYSTFIGGSDDEMSGACILDSGNRLYITGMTRSSDFPLVPNESAVIDTEYFDIYAVKLAADGSALQASTFIGGNYIEIGSYGSVLNSAGNLCITGCTFSYDFPVTENAYQKECKGRYDVFLSIINLPDWVPDKSSTTSTTQKTTTTFSTTNGTIGFEMFPVLAIIGTMAVLYKRRSILSK
ncbi:MAG: SBBP repeat-containing protein [Promethearchaeota archaeon]